MNETYSSSGEACEIRPGEQSEHARGLWRVWRARTPTGLSQTSLPRLHSVAASKPQELAPVVQRQRELALSRMNNMVCLGSKRRSLFVKEIKRIDLLLFVDRMTKLCLTAKPEEQIKQLKEDSCPTLWQVIFFFDFSSLFYSKFALIFYLLHRYFYYYLYKYLFFFHRETRYLKPEMNP